MPAKGQSCFNCSGVCCHKIISYKYRDDALKRHQLAAKEAETRGEIYWGEDGCQMNFSHKELINLGMEMIILPDIGESCSYLTVNGRCAKQGRDKPRLCKSWWCNGKLWQPRVN